MVPFWSIGLLRTNFRKEPKNLSWGTLFFWATEPDTCRDPGPPDCQNLKLVKYSHVTYRWIAFSFLVLKIPMKLPELNIWVNNGQKTAKNEQK